MAKLFMGTKPGVGAVLKVMSSSAYDPLTTPNTAFGKFRFNSERADMGYVPFLHRFGYTTAYPFPARPARNGAKAIRSSYWPAGTNASTCKIKIDSVTQNLAGTSTLKWQIYTFYWRRILGVTYPPMVEVTKASGLAAQEITRTVESFKPLPKQRNESQLFDTNSPSSYLIRGLNASSVTPLFGEDRPVTGPRVELIGGQWLSVIKVEPGEPLRHISAWALPANKTAPFLPAKARVSGMPAIHISPDMVRVARPGYNALSGTGKQMILSEAQTPARIIKTAEFVLGINASRTLACGISLPSIVKVDVVASKNGVATFSYPVSIIRTPINFQKVDLIYRVSGANVIFTNRSAFALKVRVVVFADDARAPTTGGGGATLVKGPTYTQIRRPGAKAAPVFNDILLDTRWSYLPLVTTAYVGLSGFAATPVAAYERYYYGLRRKVVTFANDGSWVPFVKWMVDFGTYFTPPMFECMEPYDKLSTAVSPHTRSSSICRISAKSVSFYLNPGNPDSYKSKALGTGGQTIYEKVKSNAYRDPIGIRYYIFAIPKAL